MGEPMERTPRPNTMRSLAVASAALGLAAPLAGCGEAGVAAGDPAEHPYNGPLYVDRGAAAHPRAGAAGNAVDCATWGAGGNSGRGVYGEGATADSPARALEVARSEMGFGGVQEDLLVAKEEDDRVLYVVEVGGVIKHAVIVRDGPATKGAGGAGWYVESWAHCDYSELPRAFTDSIGLQIWTDSTGQAVPTKAIESWVGPEHCDWQSMIFLTLGKTTYVRNPQPALAEYFADPYDPHAELPDDAIDTGYDRDGGHLWLAPDKKVAYVGTTDDIEVWPRTVDRLGCA
jgi:hypothetical protein